jgi:oxaloacetate decarboxylase beta subunit
MPREEMPKVSAGQKVTFSIVLCTVLCLLFPSAAPLFLSFFLGVAVADAGIAQYAELVRGPFLYTATFFLGLVLGVLCDASVLLDPKVLLLLVLGMAALLLSALGGLGGGYLLWWWKKGKYNPTIGIAGVSCVPTCAKLAQKEVEYANPMAQILPQAIGANVSGVITTAILAGIYVSLLR